jgi:hypothetical protein
MVYRERDPRRRKVILLHPWESGLDTLPDARLYLNEMPAWIKLVKTLQLDSFFNLVRSDTKYLPAYQRIDTIDALSLYSVARQLRRKKYETRLMLRHGHLAIEDVGFNSMLIRANALLEEICRDSRTEIPAWLKQRFIKAHTSLELLWSEETGQYFSRNFETFELVEEPSIMAFLPLYAGSISKHRAKQLVELMRSKDYWLPYPILCSQELEVRASRYGKANMDKYKLVGIVGLGDTVTDRGISSSTTILGIVSQRLSE